MRELFDKKLHITFSQLVFSQDAGGEFGEEENIVCSKITLKI